MAFLEFRDGAREVPDHLADLMRSLDTYKMTFDQACAAANAAALNDLVGKAQSKMLDQHFRLTRGR